MSTAYKVILGDPVSGQDITQYFNQDQWSIDATYGQRGRTATFFLTEDLQNKTAWSLIPQALSRITITDTGLNQVIFGGVIQTPRLYRDGVVKNYWQLTCKDGTFYADNKIVQADYSNQTLDFILKDLTAKGNCGITTHNVIAGPQIARVVINYLQLSEAWKRACSYASQGALWGWEVDDNLDLHSFDGLENLPLTTPLFTDNPNLVDFATYFPFIQDNFYYEWSGDSIRNRIKVRGGNYTGPFTDTFSGTGSKNVFAITYPVNTSQPGLSVTVGGTGVPVSIDTGSNPSSAVPSGTCLMTQTPNGQWYARFGTIPGNGDVIVVNYNFLMPVLTQVDDVPAEQQYSLQPNTLSDPGFELNSGNWLFTNSQGTGVSTIDSSNPHFGSFALKMTSASGVNYGGAFNKVGIPIVAGQTFTLSAYIKGATAGTFGPLRLVFANPGSFINANGIASQQPSGQAGIVVHDLQPSITTSYAKYSQTVTVPTGYTWAFVELYANNNGTPSTVYVDDVSLQTPSPNGGIYEMYMSDATITDILTAKARGQREIAEYGTIEERVYFQTFPGNGFHLHAGDVIQWSSSLVPDSQAGWTVGSLSAQFLITSIHIDGIVGANRRYTVTAVRVFD